MRTRAKFQCVSITKRKSWGVSPAEFTYDTEFRAVTAQDPDPDSAEFFAATPSGSIKIGTVRADHFEVGRDYYVDFSLADEAS